MSSIVSPLPDSGATTFCAWITWLLLIAREGSKAPVHQHVTAPAENRNVGCLVVETVTVCVVPFGRLRSTLGALVGAVHTPSSSLVRSAVSRVRLPVRISRSEPVDL